MRSVRSVLAVALALVLAAGATVHGARAAGMAMAWSGAAEQPCDLCGGRDGGDAAAQCALVCAGLTGIVSDFRVASDPLDDRPTAAPSPASLGRFAGPEPDPPR